MNKQPSGYEPDELPGCSIPQNGAPRRIRTCNLLIRSQMLYPIGREARDGKFPCSAIRLSDIAERKQRYQRRDGVARRNMPTLSISTKNDSKSHFSIGRIVTFEEENDVCKSIFSGRCETFDSFFCFSGVNKWPRSVVLGSDTCFSTSYFSRNHKDNSV